jgi:hypothetical protein
LKGLVFGAKLWPGAFLPLLEAPVWTLTDRAVPFKQ